MECASLGFSSHNCVGPTASGYWHVLYSVQGCDHVVAQCAVMQLQQPSTRPSRSSQLPVQGLKSAIPGTTVPANTQALATIGMFVPSASDHPTRPRTVE